MHMSVTKYIKYMRKLNRYGHLPRSFGSGLFRSSSLLLSSSSTLFLGSQVILFSFFNRLRALANHVLTCVSVILVMMANMIFSPLVGYGFFLCSLSQAFSVLVVSRVAFFRLAPFRSMPYLKRNEKKTI